jgi:YidC/Oxa1 family membrane protein insertase
MEKRAILAALLMAGLLMVYQLLFVKPPEHQPPAPVTKKEAPGPSAPAPAVPAATSVVPPKEAPEAPERKVTVEAPLYRAAVASLGGRFVAWDLNYRGLKPMVINGELGPRGLSVSRGGNPGRPIAFAVSTDALVLGKSADRGELRLVGEDGFGLRITEEQRFRADSYVVEHRITVENRHSVAQSAQLLLGWQAPVAWTADESEKFHGQHPIRTVRLAGGSVRREELAKLGGFHGPGDWVALESEWYLSALIPTGGKFEITESKRSETKAKSDKPVEIAEVALRASIPTLEPGQSWEGRVLTYVGPKEYERLKAVGVGLEKSIYFGGFPVPESYGGLPMEWLAVPILWLMRRFYEYTGNYGVAIILLTVITKVLFFPLTIKSMTSMKAMQALQPQINTIRAKYKNDAQRMQQETMALYRAHKVNPLGGCLPMVVQVPIFYALYVALSVSVELQNQPFICFGRLFGVDLWICDLASHDPTYVLPLLMGASMFIQQKITPVMGDPRQAKMMLFMPVIFTFMFLNLPSGLVLYWTLSNVLQIAQQKYMERLSKTRPPGPAGRGEAQGDRKVDKVPARAIKKA